jgi:DNA-binding HxlR family transcriptional regulator
MPLQPNFINPLVEFSCNLLPGKAHGSTFALQLRQLVADGVVENAGAQTASPHRLTPRGETLAGIMDGLWLNGAKPI